MNKIKQFSEDEASSDASENTQISGFKAPKTVTEFGLTYKSYQFLQRLASGAHHIRPEPLEAIFHELCQISKDLKLSELEIAWFGIYLSRFGWSDLDYSLDLAINFTAYAAKSVLNDSLFDIETSFLKKFESFFEEYRSWFAKHRHDINIGYYELNSKFKELSYVKPEYDETISIDYNLHVSQLLENNCAKHED